MDLKPPPPSLEGQPLDAGLTSLAGLTYVADAFVKMTGAETFALRTIAQTKSDLSLNLVENTALSTWIGSANITTLGTIATGVWEGTSISTTYTDAKCTDATADNTAANQTSHADVLVDGDVGVGVQAFGAVLDDLSVLTPPASDGQFIVATGAGAFAYESGATVRTSIGLGSVENTALSTWAGSANITTLGTIATVGNITIADGGTIGQAAGPLLTFDDTNNYLEITGCNVGIGTTTPISTYRGLDISSGGLSLIIGANNQNFTRTDETEKNGRFACAHYTNAEEPLGISLASSGVNYSYVFYGGGSGLFNAATELRFYTAADNVTTTGTVRATITDTNIKLRLPVFILEQAAAVADIATYGQLWVKTVTPNELWFTNDAGTDVQLGLGGGAFTSYCSVGLNGNQNISASTYTKVALNSETYDNDGEFTGGTFTAIAAGYYHISAAIRYLSLTSDELVRAIIYKNGVRVKWGEVTMAGPTYISTSTNVSGDVYLNGSTDYIELYTWTTEADAIDGRVEFTYMDIHRFA